MVKLVSALVVLVFLAQVCFVQCDSFVAGYTVKNGVQTALVQNNLETLQVTNEWTDATTFSTACYMQSESLFYVLSLSGGEYTIFSLNINSGEQGKPLPFQSSSINVLFMGCDPTFGLLLGTVESNNKNFFTLYTFDYSTGSIDEIVSHGDIAYYYGSFGLEPTTHTLYFQSINEQLADGSNCSFVLISLPERTITFMNYFSYFSSFRYAFYMPYTKSFVGLNVTKTNDTENLPFTYVQTEKGMVEESDGWTAAFLYNLARLAYPFGYPHFEFVQIGYKAGYTGSTITWALGAFYTSDNTLITFISETDQPLHLSYFFQNGTNHVSTALAQTTPYGFIQYIPDN